jgi:hypothetical protein
MNEKAWAIREGVPFLDDDGRAAQMLQRMDHRVDIDDGRKL